MPKVEQSGNAELELGHLTARLLSTGSLAPHWGKIGSWGQNNFRYYSGPLQRATAHKQIRSIFVVLNFHGVEG